MSLKEYIPRYQYCVLACKQMEANNPSRLPFQHHEMKLVCASILLSRDIDIFLYRHLHSHTYTRTRIHLKIFIGSFFYQKRLGMITMEYKVLRFPKKTLSPLRPFYTFFYYRLVTSYFPGIEDTPLPIPFNIIQKTFYHICRNVVLF